MEPPKGYVNEEQFHRLIAIERAARIGKRSPGGLGVEFDRFMDGLETSLGLADRVLPKRTRWSLYRYKDGETGPIVGFVKKPFRAAAEKDNYLISSLCEDGLHAPAIDVDFELMYFPAGAGTVLDFRRTCKPAAYRRLLRVCAQSGLCSEASVDALIRDTESCGGYSNATLLYCDVPARVLPSSTKKHWHLYFDVAMPWGQYAKLLKAFAEAKLLGKTEYALTMRDKMSLLIDPDLTKRRVQSRVRKPKHQTRRTQRHEDHYHDGYW